MCRASRWSPRPRRWSRPGATRRCWTSRPGTERRTNAGQPTRVLRRRGRVARGRDGLGRAMEGPLRAPALRCWTWDGQVETMMSERAFRLGENLVVRSKLLGSTVARVTAQQDQRVVGRECGQTAGLCLVYCQNVKAPMVDFYCSRASESYMQEEKNVLLPCSAAGWPSSPGLLRRVEREVRGKERREEDGW
jgi:hypothetical protein